LRRKFGAKEWKKVGEEEEETAMLDSPTVKRCNEGLKRRWRVGGTIDMWMTWEGRRKGSSMDMIVVGGGREGVRMEVLLLPLHFRPSLRGARIVSGGYRC